MITTLLYILLSSSVQMDDIRQLFTTAAEDESTCEQLMKTTDGYTMDYKPVVFAYHAAAEMTMANHVMWPVSKLSYFNGGKRKLEEVASKYNTDVEIRYVRFAVQSGSPSFLGYKDDMAQDEAYIRKNMDKTDWSSSFKKDVIALLDKY
ncbi:MAG: hypothetical protein R2780_05455 [Crocinitomicaceae bacterium]